MNASVTSEYADLLSHTALSRGIGRVTFAKLASRVEPVRAHSAKRGFGKAKRQTDSSRSSAAVAG
jgi:hypothetical protein